MRSIDIGCAQVNLMHHPDAFASLEQAFDPMANADYAARFLKQLHDTHGGRELDDGGGLLPLADAGAGRGVSPAGPSRNGRGHRPWRAGCGLRISRCRYFPGGMRPEPGRLLAAPAGTVGRGLAAYRAAPIRMAAATRLAPITVPR